MTRSIFRGVASAAVTAAALLVTAPLASAAPTLQPTPTGPVTAGQTVSVTLNGLPPGMPSVAIGQCKAQVVAPTDCNLGGSLLGTAGPDGVWQPGQRGTTVTLVATVGGIDCTVAAGVCTLAVTSLTDPQHILTSVPLNFGPPAAAPTTESAAPEKNSADDHTAAYVIGGAVVLAILVLIALDRVRRTRRPSP